VLGRDLFGFRDSQYQELARLVGMTPDLAYSFGHDLPDVLAVWDSGSACNSEHTSPAMGTIPGMH
jgi:hypothetical protein